MLQIVISSPLSVDNEVNRIDKMIASDDFDYFHLRKPSFEYNQMKAFLELLDERYLYKLIIHSNYGLISEFDLGGINMNKKALGELAYADEIDKCFIQPLVLNERKIEINRIQPEMVTYSGHTIDEINNLEFDIEYAFLSPIYDSISKAGYKSRFEDFETLKTDLQKSNNKIIALGGVTKENEKELQAVGFQGMARLGNVWSAK